MTLAVESQRDDFGSWTYVDDAIRLHGLEAALRLSFPILLPLRELCLCDGARWVLHGHGVRCGSSNVGLGVRVVEPVVD